ncbi:MAG TPA: hypothetical protein ACQGQG_08495 [Xylella sp.]
MASSLVKASAFCGLSCFQLEDYRQDLFIWRSCLMKPDVVSVLTRIADVGSALREKSVYSRAWSAINEVCVLTDLLERLDYRLELAVANARQ